MSVSKFGAYIEVAEVTDTFGSQIAHLCEHRRPQFDSIKLLRPLDATTWGDVNPHLGEIADVQKSAQRPQCWRIKLPTRQVDRMVQMTKLYLRDPAHVFEMRDVGWEGHPDAVPVASHELFHDQAGTLWYLYVAQKEGHDVPIMIRDVAQLELRQDNKPLRIVDRERTHEHRKHVQQLQIGHRLESVQEHGNCPRRVVRLVRKAEVGQTRETIQRPKTVGREMELSETRHKPTSCARPGREQTAQSTRRN